MTPDRFFIIGLVAFAGWIFIEFRFASNVWMRILSGLIFFVLAVIVSTSTLSKYTDYLTGVQVAILKQVREKLEQKPKEEVIAFLDAQIPLIDKHRNSAHEMHELIMETYKKHPTTAPAQLPSAPPGGGVGK